MKLIYDSWLDDYTLEASSAAANFPAANVQQIHLAKPWRTIGIVDESILIDAGFGNTLNPTAAAIAGHNLSSGATVKIQGNDADLWVGPTVNETIIWRAGVMTYFFTGSGLRFWRFHFADAANPDGYIQAGRLMLGDHLQMPAVQPDVNLPRRTTSRRVESITGQVYTDRGVSFRVPGFVVPVVTEAERQAMQVMWDEVENAGPLVLVIWEDSLAIENAIYCVLDQDELPWQLAAEPGVLWNTALQFREVF